KDLSSFFALVKLIRKIKPDVIHTHTAKAGVLGRLASIVAGGRAKRVHTFHGHLLHGYFSAPKRTIMISMERTLALFTFRIIAIGNVVKNDLLAVGIGSVKKFLVFFPGLPEPKPVDRIAKRNELGLDAATLYCTFVGRLTYIKRPDRLLDVAVLLEARGIKVHFLVAGEGEQFESSKERARHDKLPMTFLGWRSDTDAILVASDIAILCSDNECIPLTLIQAAQAALPIVATNVGSISDIVVDGTNGLLTDVSAGALADAIEKLANQPSLRASMGAAGKKRSHELFSLTRMISDHSLLYSHCMQGSD
ncbi:MAG: glycosyltransferase, partial [Actinobacteria bacterium]|nr:glycosyltransferase [Actinomycetota bacterium]